MGDDDAAAAFEAALGLNPQRHVDGVLEMVADICAESLDFCAQEAATPGVLGADRAAQKAAGLERGLIVIRHVVNDVLDKRMTCWEKYCLKHIFTLPEGFIAPENDNSCAKESLEDRTSDSDLDVELDSLRRNLENVYKESGCLRRELSSLERKTTHKRKYDPIIAEIQKLVEDESVQQNFADLAKALPVWQQKIISLNKKRTEPASVVRQQDLRDNKRVALDMGCTARTEDVQEIINILQNK